MAEARRRRRAARWVGAASLLAGSAWIAWPDQARAADLPASALGAYSVSAVAPGMQVTYDFPSASLHPQAEGEIPYSVAQLQSGPQGYALSTVAWPGPLAANAGTTAQLLNLGLPAAASSQMDEPVRAEARTGTDPSTVTNNTYPGLSMNATATPSMVTSNTILAGASGPAPQSGTGATETKSVAEATGPQTVTGTAHSVVQDINLAGGLIHIAAVTSNATALSDASNPTASGSTTVTGLSVAGQAAYVDEAGLHLGQSGPGAPVNSVAAAISQQALSGAGMQVAVSQPQTQKQGGQISYTTGNVVFYWAPPGDSHGDTFTATFGGASVTVSATSSFGTGYDTTFDAPAGSDQGGSVAGAGDQAATSDTSSSAGAVTAPVGPTADAVTGAAPALSSSGPAATPEGANPTPRLAAESFPLYHGIPPAAVVLVALGSLLLGAGLRRLPDKVLAQVAGGCTNGDGE